MHWLLHWLGMDNPSGAVYAAWSGWGGDVGQVVIIGGLLHVARKHNCHVHGCWRIGRHAVEGTSYVVCRRHHPDGHLTHAGLLEAHAAARRPGLEERLAARFKAHCADVKEHVSAVADARVSAGAGSNPAKSEGLPADAPSAKRVVPPAATPRSHKRRVTPP